MTISKKSLDLDVRIRERNLKNNVLKADDVKAFIDALPDVAGNVDATGVPQPGTAVERPQPQEQGSSGGDHHGSAGQGPSGGGPVPGAPTTGSGPTGTGV